MGGRPLRFLSRRLASGLLACLIGVVSEAPATAATRDRVMPHARLAREGAWGWMPRVRETGAARTLEDERRLVWRARAALRLGTWDEAIRAYEAVPPHSPWRLEALEALAYLYGRTDRPVRARGALTTLLPSLVGARAEESRRELARLCLEAGDPEAALRVLRPILEAPRGEGAVAGHAASLLDAMWLAGLSAKAVGHGAFALGRFQDVARLAPGTPRAGLALLEIVNHHMRMGRPGHAADALARYVAGQHPTLPGIDLGATLSWLRAEQAAREQDWGRAVEGFSAAESHLPLRDASLYGKAWALWRLQRGSEALQALAQFRAEGGTGVLRAPALYLEARLLQEAGHLPEAEARYLEVERTEHGEWAEQALFQRAGLALRAGRTDTALALAATIVRDHPGGRMAAAALWLLAEAQLSQGRTEEAVQSYQRLAGRSDALLLLGGKGASVVFKLGLAYLRAGDEAAAEAAFAKVADPTLVAEARFWQAEAASRRDRHREAVLLFERMIKEHPESGRIPDAWYGLAWSRLESGDARGAAEAFSQAAARLPDSRRRRDSRYHLALLWLDDGRPAEARDLLAQVIQTVPDERGSEAAFWLAEAMADQEDWLAAAAQYAACVAQGGERGREARRQQAAMLERASRWADAARVWEAVLADSAGVDATRAHKDLLSAARASSRAGDAAGAAAYYARLAGEAKGLPGEQDTLWKPLVEAQLAAGAWSEASEVLTGVASASPWAPDLLRRVAEGHGQSGQWRAAAATWAALPIQDAPTRLARAGALEKAGDLLGAAEVLAEALVSVSEGRDVLRKDLCRLYAALDLPERERTTLDEWMKEASADASIRAEAWMAYGERMVRREDLLEAAVALRAALQGLAPGEKQWKSRYWLAATLVNLSRLDDAEGVLKPLCNGPWPTDPSSRLISWRAQARLLQGQILENRGRWTEAEKVYKELAANKRVSAAQRKEAEARLAFIARFVRPGTGGRR